MGERKLSDYTIRMVQTTEFRNERINGIDFSGRDFEHARFFDCEVTDTSFDNANCRDLRTWGTTFRNCTFRKTNLRDSGMGGVDGKKINVFENVDFAYAEMRGTAYKCAIFKDCRFEHTNLRKVDFQGSRFINCVFIGELREVGFYDHAFGGESFPANRMEGVDFSGAQLRLVDFRRLDLTDVVFPTDEDHLLIRNYPAFLSASLGELEGDASHAGKVLGVMLKHFQKWLGPEQSIGVINRLDFLESKDGSETVAKLDELVSKFAA